LNKDSLALKEAAINRGDEEATADMQQDAGVAFYWDGGDCAKNGGAAWLENNRRAGVMFVILAVIACGSAVIACGSAVIACGSAAVTQFQFYGDNFADTTLLMCYYHCNQPQDNIGMALRVCVLLWMALLTLPLLAWRFLPMLKIFPPPSSPMGALDFTRASHAWAAATSSLPRPNCWSWMDSNVRWLFFLLVLLTPVCTAGEAASVAAPSLLSSTAFNTTATINTWTSLNASINAAAGKSTALTLSASCSGYTAAISIGTAYTNVTIVGNGATFDGGGYPYGGQFFHVGEKAVLAMSNVALKNGYLNGGNGGAVCVASGGTFTVTSSALSGNQVLDAGAQAHGGAVYVASGGTFAVISSAFSGNQAGGTHQQGDGAYGGAVYVATGGTFTVTRSTFSGNQAWWGTSWGGAVCVATGGTFAVTSSTFSENTANGQGGAVFSGNVPLERRAGHGGVAGGTFTVTSSVFSGNIAYTGGALGFDGGTGLIKNCTFAGPISQQHNGIYNKGGNVTFACADAEVGTPVQMQGTEIAVIPPKELQCTTGNCFCRDSKCVADPTATLPCTKCETPGACV
jgi:predicted outer membrane repeat protein